MMLTTTNIPLKQMLPVVVGNVYVAKGGRGKTQYWAVVAITETDGCALLGLDADGNVVSVAAYNKSAMRERQLVGRCPELAGLTLEIQAT